MDHYKVLGVRREATTSEIKSAFRRRAKRLHPDAGGRDANEFNALVESYNALLKKREEDFFARHQEYENTEYKCFNYHDYLMYERTDYESKAKLIVFDLLHHNEDEAVEVYTSMARDHADFRFSYWFCREDFMDLGYILCEELVARGEFYDAVLILDEIITLERQERYFKVFFSEVLKFSWTILKKNIDGVLNDELCLDVWERALEWGLDERKVAFINAKMEKAYKRIEDEWERSKKR